MMTFEVNDMTCGHCASMITKAVRQIDAGARVAVDLASKRVQIASAHADEAELTLAIQEAGYTPTKPTATAPEPKRAGGGCCGCH